MFAIKILFFTFVFISCTSMPLANFEGVVKKRAAFDFSCPETYVNIVSDGITEFLASGCGKKGKYEVKCSLGPCVARPL